MTDTKWEYGDSFEKYPIYDGETWVNDATGSVIRVSDLRNGVDPIHSGSDIVYTDPPWNKAITNRFIRQAGRAKPVDDFNQFVDMLFTRIEEHGAPVCYIEIGKQSIVKFEARLVELYDTVQKWDIVYYGKHPCYLLRGGSDSITTDFTGIDDTLTPSVAIRAEVEHGEYTRTNPPIVSDFMMGRGTTMMAALSNGASFRGTEFNNRKLAVALENADLAGYPFRRV